LEQAIELALTGFEAVSRLLDWLVQRLNDFGLPFPLWLFHSLVAVLFLGVSIWIWRWDKKKYDWPIRLVCAIVPLAIPFAVILKWTGVSDPIPGVNLYVLQQKYSTEQNDIVVLPFSLSAQDEAFLQSDIRRLIVTYAQDAGVSDGHRDISLVNLPSEAFTIPIPQDDRDWIRLVGTAVNALGVLGIAENEQNGLIRGWFNVVPNVDNFRVLTESIDSHAYADPEFYSQVQERWGRATVLAIAVREYRRGLALDDKDALYAARKYFVSVQRELGGNDESLAQAIASIVADIDATPKL